MAKKQKLDGGQVALIGFLYQMVGALSLFAWAKNPKMPAEPANLEALLAVIKEGDLYHERGDVDALARQLGVDQPDTFVLIQFKYSQNPQEDPITPSKLAEIGQGFLRGLQQCSSGSRRILFRVITNRPISPTLRPVLEQPEGHREHSAFERTELHHVLQKTEILEKFDFSPFQKALRLFANDYGTDEEEYEQGLHMLIGMLVDRATKHHDQPIFENDLIKAFRGHAHLRKLTITAIRDHTSARRKDMMHMLGLQEMPLQRKKLIEEAMIKLKEHALLIFQGPGGSGKSVLAWNVLQNILEEANESEGSATAFLPLRFVKSLSWLVGGWMGIPEDKRNEPIEQVIRRLKIANPQAHPVLCLGIDGLDEKNEMIEGQSSLQQTIEWFGEKERALQLQRAQTGTIEPPDATLILTCRDRDLLHPILGTSLWPEMKANDDYALSIKDFSPEELLEAVEQSMFPHLERFKQALADRSHLIVTLPQTIRTIDIPVHQETLQALQHPAMWYAVRQLTEEEQAYLLDGKAQAFHRLAALFLEWFSIKVQRRRPGWGKEHISEALEEVAYLAVRTEGTQFPYRIWKDVGKKGCRLEGRAVSEDLYQEALSGGLIIEWEPKKVWQWRHPFVGIYLAQLVKQGEVDNE
jgi:hypothetical protein